MTCLHPRTSILDPPSSTAGESIESTILPDLELRISSLASDNNTPSNQPSCSHYFPPVTFAKTFLKTLLPYFLTAAAGASPLDMGLGLDANGEIILDEAHGGFELFKRDAILDTRDLNLAEIHGVNLTESKLYQTYDILFSFSADYLTVYKHSHIKRDGGDHINI